jgi:polysaccharide pyruvyl transferase WcaK-like protein
MKSSRPVITLLGNNSGRNLGDAAILSSILNSFQNELPNAEFLVPSINPKFIDENYGEYFNVEGVDVRPLTGSIRLLGIPTIRALAKSDVAMICDGIIFGRKLFSVHNFLITLIFLVPFARYFKCKLVAFCCGIGPFPSRLSEYMARWLLNSCDMIIMRESESKRVAEELGVTRPIEVRGDVAFLNPISPKAEGIRILTDLGIDTARPIIGVNVTPYIDSWLRKSERLANPESFLDTVAQGLEFAFRRIGDEPQYVVFSCSPMDEEYSRMLGRMIDAPVVTNSDYLSHDIQSVMRECQLFVGMRFHSLILSSSVGVPIVGMVYAPKVRDYFSFMDCSDVALELIDITPEILADTVVAAWENRVHLGERQGRVIESLRGAAATSVKEVVRRYFPMLFRAKKPAGGSSKVGTDKGERKEKFRAV